MADKAFLDSLYNDYVDDLYSYAQNLGFDKQTSMDAIHDVFCKIYANEKLLDKIQDIRFYLLRSLKNRLIDIYRSQKAFQYLSLESTPDELPFTVKLSVEDEMISAEDYASLKTKVEEILQVLTDRQREIIYLRYIYGYDYQKISELMHISVPACHKLMHKAMTKLKENNRLPLVLLFILLS